MNTVTITVTLLHPTVPVLNLVATKKQNTEKETETESRVGVPLDGSVALMSEQILSTQQFVWCL